MKIQDPTNGRRLLAAVSYERLEEQNAELFNCLVKLSNEVIGSVELARPCIGNTNANCLLTRAFEARNVIAKVEGRK